MLFESPYLASVLGLLFGFILIGSYGVVALKFTGEQAKLGLYVSMALSFIELIVALAVLLLYRNFAKAGFIWFGCSMAIGFIAGFIFLVLKLVHKKKV